MKRLLTFLAVTLFTAVGINAQSPSPGIFNYQGVARNSVGNVLINKTITLRLTIHDGTASGATVYQESRTVITNPFGLFNVQVGSPGATGVTGTIAGVNWGVNSKFIQVEIDPNGGTSFINIGTAQMAAVPYALYSSISNDLVLPFNKTQSDAGSLFRVNNSGAGGGIYGTATSGNGVQGTATTGTGGLFSSTSGLALNTAGGLRHTGIGEGAPIAPALFKLLAGDATGNATWKDPSAVGLITGTGTLNYLPKWTPNGTTLGNSRIFDDGTFVGIGTTTPGAGLVVSGNGIWNSAIGIQNSGTGMEWRMNVNGTTFGITKIPGATFTPFTLLSDGQVEFPSTAGATRFHILDNGNVGVGLNNPSVRLEVQGIERINNTTTQEGGELRFQEGTLFGAPNHWIIDNFQSFAGGNKFRLWNDVGGMNIQMMPGGKTAIGNMVFSDQPQSVLDVEGNLAVGATYSGTTAAPVNGAIIEGTVGIGTNAPTGKLHVLNTSATAFNTALFNQNNAGNTAIAMLVNNVNTTATAYGNGAIVAQRGTNSLANTYLYTGIATAITGIAASATGFGVQGTSETGYGVTGLSTNGIAVHGINLNSGNAARFENALNTGNAAPTVIVNNIATVGSAYGVQSTIASTTPGGFSTALRGINNGTGGLGIGVWGSQNGSGWGVLGQAPSGLGVYGNTSSGVGVYADANTGWGMRAISNSNTAIYATSTSGFGGDFRSNTNYAGRFQTLDAGNNAPSIVTLNTSQGLFSRAIYSQGSGYSGYYWGQRQVSEFQSDSTLGVGIVSRYGSGLQSASETGYGVYAQIFNSTGFGNAAVVGQSNNINSHGLYGIAPAGGIGRALVTNGPLQLTGVGEANNYVLTSDASGNATWQSLGVVGGVSGSGTLNRLPKWTPNGSTLGNSLLYDNGFTVGIGAPTYGYPFEIAGIQAGAVFTDTDNGTQIGLFAPGTGYTGGVGTSTNHDLAIYSANIDRITVKNSGRIGVNNVNPASRFHSNEIDGINIRSDVAYTTAAALNSKRAGNAFQGTNVNYTILSKQGAPINFNLPFNSAAVMGMDSTNVIAANGVAGYAVSDLGNGSAGVYGFAGKAAAPTAIAYFTGYSGGTFWGGDNGVTAGVWDAPGLAMTGTQTIKTGVQAYVSSTNAGTNAGLYVLGVGGGTTNYAALLNGDVTVNGNFTASGVKAFRIDHPLDPANKYLNHFAMESPEVQNVYNGNIKTDANGKAIVNLPGYFSAINKDFKYQLTIVDEEQFAMARISKKINGNTFEIMTSVPNIEVSWQVTAVRNDKEAQKYALPAEMDKPAPEKGKYLNPELHGQNAGMTIFQQEKNGPAIADKSTKIPFTTVPEMATPKGKSMPEPAKAIESKPAVITNTVAVEKPAIPLLKPVLAGELQKGTMPVTNSLNKPEEQKLDQLNKGQGTESKAPVTEQPATDIKLEKAPPVEKPFSTSKTDK